MASFKTVDIEDASGIKLKSFIDTNDIRISDFGKPPKETANIIENIQTLPVREEDVLLWSVIKSGSHWVFEIMHMIINGKIESTDQIDYTFLEMVPQSVVEAVPSPRILSSHLPFRLLPKQMKEKKTKIVALVRNPKDTSISLYHLDRGLKWIDYQGTFEDYLQLYMKGQTWYGMWFDSIRDIEDVSSSGEYNVHLMFYENLKKNGFEEIKKLAEFLEVPVSDDFCQAVKEKCDFETMRKDKEQEKSDYFKPGFTWYRKGQIGDWKNHFTVAMNEVFDKWFEEGMKNSKLQFQFV